MKITITAEDILLAVRKNSHRCMIADAIKRDVSGANRVVVDLQSIRWTDEKEGIRYFFFTPPVAQEALLAFDQGLPVQPFEFELRKPAQVRPQGFDDRLRTSRERREEDTARGRRRRSAPTPSEQGPIEQKRQRTARTRAQVKLRDTEREFGICRVKEHPLKKASK